MLGFILRCLFPKPPKSGTANLFAKACNIYFILHIFQIKMKIIIYLTSQPLSYLGTLHTAILPRRNTLGSGFGSETVQDHAGFNIYFILHIFQIKMKIIMYLTSQPF